MSDLTSIRNSARPLSSSRIPADVFHQKNKSFTLIEKGAESARPYDISMANIEDNRSYLWKVIENAYDPVYSSTFGNFTHYNSFKYLKSQIEQTGETLPTSPDTMSSPRPPSSSRLSKNLLTKHRAERMKGSVLNNEAVRGLHRISQHNESQSSGGVAPVYPPRNHGNLVTFRKKEKEAQVKTLNEIKEIYREQKKTYYKRRPLLESAVSRYYSSLPKQTRHIVIKRNISSIQRSIDPVQISSTDNTASRLSGLASGTGEFSGFRSDSRASNHTLNFDKSVSDMINKSFTVGYGPTRGRGISNVALVQGFKIK